jgi:hypothetical protein
MIGNVFRLIRLNHSYRKGYLFMFQEIHRRGREARKEL